MENLLEEMMINVKSSTCEEEKIYKKLGYCQLAKKFLFWKNLEFQIKTIQHTCLFW